VTFAYAFTRSRQLRAWDLKTRALRTLRRDGVIGIARDGAVALSASGHGGRRLGASVRDE
jgi:hypothetical protein